MSGWKLLGCNLGGFAGIAYKQLGVGFLNWGRRVWVFSTFTDLGTESFQ